MSTANPVQPEGITIPMDLPTSYDENARIAIDVSPYDAVSLFFEVAGSITTFSFRLRNDGYLYMRSEDGATVAEETDHTVADAEKFAVRVNTEGVNELEVQMKANVGTVGGLKAFLVAAGGTDNRARHGMPVETAD